MKQSPLCSNYRATLRRSCEASVEERISLICEGLDERAAALNAEYMAPGFTCIALSHYSVGFVAQKSDQAWEVMRSIMAVCAHNAKIGRNSVGSINFRVLSEVEAASEELLLDEIHLLNPDGKWESSWRALLLRATVVNAHFIGTPVAAYSPVFRNYVWESKDHFVSAWSFWYVTTSAEELLSVDVGYFERSGPLSCAAFMTHLKAESADLVIPVVDRLLRKAVSAKLTAIWISLAAPPSIPAAILSQIRHRFETVLKVEPEMRLSLQEHLVGIDMTVVIWVPISVSAEPVLSGG
ncbi:MAG: hypothetical protein V7751_07550 [Pseudoalteromonas distincta]